MATRTAVRRQLAEYRRKRDFGVTGEPEGGAGSRSKATKKAARKVRAGTLQFVIQKHRASHLHFDWRMEVDAVMKSWAVPKGPSLDPSVKRLAMQVEDHPMEYNDFEGVIPAGQYGGGTVMLWDRGTYTADDAEDGDDEAVMREGVRKGKLAVTLHGKRLKGSFALVRMRGRDTDGRQWLLLKHDDAAADPNRDIVEEVMTSVASSRTMEEIASQKSRVWQSNRKGSSRRNPVEADDAEPADAAPRRGRGSAAANSRAKMPKLEPMLARVADRMPSGDQWTFEPKYDGIRVLAYATAAAVRLVTRNGNDKTTQFPEIAEALRGLARRTRRDLVLDGEIVALDNGEPARFQALQGRMHVREQTAISGHRTESPSGFIAFDVLIDGSDVLVHEPWRTRRAHLEKRLAKHADAVVRIAETSADGDEMLRRAAAAGWEGLIAKRVDAKYELGVRSKCWLKLKLEHRQEFLVGGYTEPRNSREHIGALLVGYYDRGRLIYAGHVGGGFSRASLADMYQRLSKLETSRPPFEESPKTNEPAHWVRPKVVVEVRFNEWTGDGKLRQPIFLGVRTDKKPEDIRLEAESLQQVKRGGASEGGAAPTARSAAKSKSDARSRRRKAGAPAKSKASTARAKGRRRSGGDDDDADGVAAQLRRIEDEEGSGELTLGETTLEVTNLGKVYFPDDGITKGDLLRYYARIAPRILPTIADRPLVLKRYPNGIGGPSFYQHKAPDAVPDGVRVDVVENDRGERMRRFIGGDLPTLLYVVQLGAISIDPWHTRITSIGTADYSIIDLDPGPRATFDRVIAVAQFVRERLDELGLRAGVKTSGATGMHVVIPLEAGVPEDAALLIAQLVATEVASRSPKLATVERSLKARPPATVYVDYLQNIRGKTVAGVYSARARPGATVSMPLSWSEVAEGLDPRDYTIETVPSRIRGMTDQWQAMLSRPNTLRELTVIGQNS